MKTWLFVPLLLASTLTANARAGLSVSVVRKDLVSPLSGLFETQPIGTVGSSLLFSRTTPHPSYGSHNSQATYTQLWVTDGTGAGTLPVKIIGPQNDRWVATLTGAFTASGGACMGLIPSPVDPLSHGGGADDWFTWWSDGTPTGTVDGNLQLDSPSMVKLGNDALFFTKTTLFRGTCAPGGTQPIATFPVDSRAEYRLASDSKHAVFVTSQGSTKAVWVTDGTAAGTRAISGALGYGSIPLVGVLDGTVLYFMSDLNNGKIYSVDIKASSWAPQIAATTTARDLRLLAHNASHGLTFTGVAAGGTSGKGQRQACVTKGTAESCISDVTDLVPHEGGWLVAQATSTAATLLRTDGEFKTTIKLVEGLRAISLRPIVPGRIQGQLADPQSLESWSFFVGENPATGSELWATDGTAVGTAVVVDANPGSLPGFAPALRVGGIAGVLGKSLYFTGINGSGTNDVEFTLYKVSASLTGADAGPWTGDASAHPEADAAPSSQTADASSTSAVTAPAPGGNKEEGGCSTSGLAPQGLARAPLALLSASLTFFAWRRVRRRRSALG